MAAAGAMRQGSSSHRHVVVVVGGGGGGKEATPCWASLHVDLTQLIAARVLATGGFLDYVRFRAVCSGWRAAAAAPRGRGLLYPRLHPRRWMLFPEGFGQRPGHPAHGGGGAHARFLDVSTAGAIVRVPVPELEDHHVLDYPSGLLLLLRLGDTALRLLHPFTGDVADLPSFHRLARQLKQLLLEEPPPAPGRARLRLLRPDVFYFYRTLSRELCSAVSVAAAASGTTTITVMLALAPVGRVAVASAGDEEWTLSSWSWEEDELQATLSYQGKLYVVNQKCKLTHVSRIDPPLPRRDGDAPLSSPPTVPPPRTVATLSSSEIYLPSLVELDSEIMLVGYKSRACSCILVLKIDLVLGRTVPVTCIGDHVIFSGARSLCVSSDWLPSICRNSIICSRANHIAQYSLTFGAWSPASDEDTCFDPPKSPCELVRHIFTCCYRRFWNTGLLFHFGAWIPDWRERLPDWI